MCPVLSAYRVPYLVAKGTFQGTKIRHLCLNVKSLENKYGRDCQTANGHAFVLGCIFNEYVVMPAGGGLF